MFLIYSGIFWLTMPLNLFLYQRKTFFRMFPMTDKMIFTVNMIVQFRKSSFKVASMTLRQAWKKYSKTYNVFRFQNVHQTELALGAELREEIRYTAGKA